MGENKFKCGVELPPELWVKYDLYCALQSRIDSWAVPFESHYETAAAGERLTN